MSVSCGVCGQLCGHENDTIKCSGSCGKDFHLACAKLERKPRGKKDWSCDQCKVEKEATSSKHSSKSSTMETSITKEFIVKTLEAFKQQVMEEFKKYSADIKEFEKAISHFSEQMDASNKLNEELGKRLQVVEKENKMLLAENTELRGAVVSLQARMRDMEQYSRRSNVEISGVPETENEDLDAVLQDVAAAVGVEYDKDRVVAAHRVPSFNKKRTPPIIVRFSTYRERDAWLAAFKHVRPLTARQINASFNTAQVYLNEHISPENKLLLSKTKKVARSKNYEYIWCKEGKIFVRKANGSPCKKIENECDLGKL